MSPTSSWWSPTRHADRRGLLLARNRIQAAIRAWFVSQDFVEVDPACLQVSPGNETHLHAFKTQAVGTDLNIRDLYLDTSPEFAMKKLLAAGEQRIFAFAPAFRNRERGPLHAPEFRMLEWYRAGAGYETLWDDCAAIVEVAARAIGVTIARWRDRTTDVTAPFRKTTLDQAFTQHAGIALRETYDAAATDRDAVAAAARAAAIQFTPTDTWSDIFSRILTEKIEPNLGAPAPEVLCDYPVHEAALARPKPSDPSVAERFELYISGVEIANGFGELTDPIEQRRRFATAMDAKQAIYGDRYPIDEDFLAALAHMPPASGCALGFDRLVMLLTGATHIDQVQWTPLPDVCETRS